VTIHQLLAFGLRREPTDALRRLLADLAHWSQPAVYDDTARHHFAAAIVDDPGAVGFLPVDLPYAVWIDGADADGAARAALDDRVRAVLATDLAVASAAGEKGCFVPSDDLAVADARPVPPFVRARLRKARGLPADAVVSIDDRVGVFQWCGQPCGRDSIDTALALAAVVDVRGSDVVRALAWGAPCVVDTETARTFRLTDGVDALVADEPRDAIRRVLDDGHLAARLGRAAREHYEAQFDPARVAAIVARRLDLLPIGAERLPALIAELGGHSDGRTSVRVGELVEGLA